MKKAFTIIELLVVVSISVLVGTTTLIGFGLLRDSTEASNNALLIKTVIRDAQDKALTFSVYNDAAGTSPYKNRWVYGYSLEYNSTTRNYNLYSIIAPNTLIPTAATNTNNLRSLWTNATNSCTQQNPVGSPLTGVSFPDAGGAPFCYLEKSYPISSNIINNNPCNVLFTTVNGNITIRGGNSCYVQVNRNSKDLTLTLATGGFGTLKICDGRLTACP